jgi:hypothetical protein
MDFSFEVPGLELSVVDSHPEELLLLTVNSEAAAGGGEGEGGTPQSGGAAALSEAPNMPDAARGTLPSPS